MIPTPLTLFDYLVHFSQDSLYLPKAVALTRLKKQYYNKSFLNNILNYHSKLAFNG